MKGGMFMHIDHAQQRSIRRWGLGIAATVIAAMLAALAIGIPKVMIAQTTAIATLTEQVRDLRDQLVGVPNMQRDIAHLQAHQSDLERRVEVIENDHDHRGGQ
jgi:hypothetical protein